MIRWNFLNRRVLSNHKPITYIIPIFYCLDPSFKAFYICICFLMLYSTLYSVYQMGPMLFQSCVVRLLWWLRGGSLGILQLCLFSDITQCALYIVFVLCPLQLCCLMIVLKVGWGGAWRSDDWTQPMIIASGIFQIVDTSLYFIHRPSTSQINLGILFADDSICF